MNRLKDRNLGDVMEMPLLETIFSHMRRVRPAFRKLFSMASDLTDMEIAILGKIMDSEKEEVLIKDLFDELSPIRPSKLTQVTNKLENKGLIKKERDRKDRRRIKVFITKEGQSEYERLQERMKEILSDSLKGLREEELIQLSRSLEIWEKALKNL